MSSITNIQCFEYKADIKEEKVMVAVNEPPPYLNDYNSFTKQILSRFLRRLSTSYI